MKRSNVLKAAVLITALGFVAPSGIGISLGTVYDAAGSEGAFDTEYKKIGAIYHDEYGMMNWYQYAYNENDILISERCNSYDFGSYSEIIYNENGQKESELYYDGSGNVMSGMVYSYNANGDLIGENAYLETDSMINAEYGYDYDSDGRKLIKYKRTVNNPDWFVISEYIYHADGYLEKEIVHDEWSDTTIQEYIYDEQGNVLESVYSDDFTGQSYSHNGYDENGTLLTTTFFSQMDGVETTYQYDNKYDAAGNLISSFNFYPNGAVCTSMEYIYANVDNPGQYYSLDEIYAYQTEMNNGEVFYKEFTEEEIFAQIESCIYAGDTVFTFGYKSWEYMTLKEVSLWETGNDTYGDYMEVRLRYDSSYGDFEVWGKVYYMINGNDIIITKCEDDVAWNAENPVFDKMDPSDINSVNFKVNYGRYYQVERDEAGRMNAVEGENLIFGNNGVFNYVVNDQVYQYGEYMILPSDLFIYEHNYDFTLTFCVNGLCKTYYCRTLEQRTAMYVCEYDVETETIISHETWVSESGINSEEFMNRLTRAE